MNEKLEKYTSEIARNICPNWMSPLGNAHYMDVKRGIEKAIKHGMTLAAEHIRPVDASCGCDDCDIRESVSKSILKLSNDINKN